MHYVKILTNMSTKLITNKLNVIHELKFDSIYAEITNKDFQALGFNLGDSLNVYFSNGFKLIDIPYYDGFYTKTGEYMVSAYPSYPYVSIGINNKAIWGVSGLKEQDETVQIELNEKGKYLNVQEAFSQKHPPIRDYYASDEAFANFRLLKAKNLKKDFLIRGGSPICNDFGFMKIADDLLLKYNVQYILNLSETKTELDNIIVDLKDYYTYDLYQNNAISCLDLSANPRDKNYAIKLCNGLKEMLKFNKGPIYFHCVEGKDRTGFLSVLFLALGGGTMEDFEQDYMLTYKNFFYIDKDKTPQKYKLIYDLYFISNVMNFLCGTENEIDFGKYNFYDEAIKYLHFGNMSDKDIEELIKFICF